MTVAEKTPAKTSLTLAEIAQSLRIDGTPASTSWFDAAAMLEYRRLSPRERDDMLLDVVDLIQDERLAPSGAHRIDAWRRGWGEILDRAQAGDASYEALCPQYFKYRGVRLFGDYAQIGHPLFEFALCHAVKVMLYNKYIKDGDRIIDLGTGTGSNVYLLLKMFGSSEVIGTDWAEPSVALVDGIARQFDGRARGARLDMLSLDGAADVGSIEGSVLLSVHAFEQLGNGWGKILDHMIAGRPRLVVQIEPVIEHYANDTLFDRLAVLYHRKRNYLDGYLTELRRREALGQIEIVEAFRAPYGTMVHEPYGILVWRPR